MKKKKILIANFQRENFIYLEPFLRNLREFFPKGKIYFLTLQKLAPYFNLIDLNYSLIDERLYLEGLKFEDAKRKYDYFFNLDEKKLPYQVKSNRYFQFKLRKGTYLIDNYNYLLQTAMIPTPYRFPQSYQPFWAKCLCSQVFKKVIYFGRKEDWILSNAFNFSFPKNYLFYLLLETRKDIFEYYLVRKKKLERVTENLSWSEVIHHLIDAEWIISRNYFYHSICAYLGKKNYLITSRQNAFRYLVRNKFSFWCVTVEKVNLEKEKQEFVDLRLEEEKNLKKVIVTKSGGLGDLILAYSMLKTISRVYPDFTLMLIPYMKKLLGFIPFVKKVITYDNIKKKDFSYLKKLWGELKKGKFELAFLPNSSFRILLLFYLAKIKKIYQNSFNHKDRLIIPVIQQNYLPLQKGGIDIAGDFTYPRLKIEETNLVKKFFQKNSLEKGKYFLLNVGAGWETKLWDKWEKLIEILLRKYELPILLLWGPREEKMAFTLKEKFQDEKKVLVLPLTGMEDAAFLIKNALVTITGDTGIMHLADVIGEGVCALFGPTSPVRWGPISPLSVVVYKKVKCSPCNKEVCPLLLEAYCMKEIEVIDVLAALNYIIGKKKGYLKGGKWEYVENWG